MSITTSVTKKYPPLPPLPASAVKKTTFPPLPPIPTNAMSAYNRLSNSQKSSILVMNYLMGDSLPDEGLWSDEHTELMMMVNAAFSKTVIQTSFPLLKKTPPSYNSTISKPDLVFTSFISRSITKILSGENIPAFEAFFQDTPEDRSLAIKDIAKMYGRFLTNAAHTEPTRFKYIWIDPIMRKKHFPSAIEVDTFVKHLIQAMEDDLSSNWEQNSTYTYIHIKYLPEEGPLLKTLLKPGIYRTYADMFPKNSLTILAIKDGRGEISVKL